MSTSLPLTPLMRLICGQQGLESVESTEPHKIMATFFRSFLFLFCFFQVLNALGKLAAKDIWIQEPEAEVSLVAPSL